GSKDFCRIKVGIGRPTEEDGTAITDEEVIVNYVLSDFTLQEDVAIKPTITRVAEAISCVITDGITAAMNHFN
ncbi:MAG: aminoacyl-tRNA hydrolase, partial [Candidatus Bathyarchaeota archaeon]|nr:aminoacyl-tRNA hydrolase [Candidatus Bathyarchaeota archaeon]